MNPSDQLFNSFAKKIEAITPIQFEFEETRALTTDILSHARENCHSISIPRLGHYRTALQRMVNPEGLAVPNGKIYITKPYESFTLGDGSTDVEYNGPNIEYDAKMLVLTSDKTDTHDRLKNTISKVFEEHPRNKSVFIVFGIVAPKDTPKVTNVDTIMFSVVQSDSGEAFGFTFKENSNKGKVIPKEALSDEWDKIRDKVGPIDTCSVEAIKLDSNNMALIRDELQRAKHAFEGNRKETRSKLNTDISAQAIGQSVLKAVKGFTAKRPSRDSS
jgi:hypothetical protein